LGFCLRESSCVIIPLDVRPQYTVYTSQELNRH
jgi:hypothetical protein